jgi:hypothetical protein
MNNRERLLSGLKTFIFMAEKNDSETSEIIKDIKSLIKVIEVYEKEAKSDGR